MKYAAQTEDGVWTGTIYDELTTRITAHHAQYGETLHPVIDLTEIDGLWTATLPSVAELREIMSCSRFQGREVLRQDDLLDAADAAILASGDETLIGAWRDTATWTRTSQNITSISAALGLDDVQIDALFARAITITA